MWFPSFGRGELHAPIDVPCPCLSARPPRFSIHPEVAAVSSSIVRSAWISSDRIERRAARSRAQRPPAVGARRQHAGVRCAPLRARGAGDCLLATSQVASPSRGQCIRRRNSSAGAVNSVCYPPPIFRLASENPERPGYISCT
jgi:hypothetical protein